MFEDSREMKELREIRDKNYEETKDMNTSEIIEYFRKKSESIELKMKQTNRVRV